MTNSSCALRASVALIRAHPQNHALKKTRVYNPTNSPKYTCQKCRNKIPKDDLETVFIEQIKHFAVSPDEIGKHLDQANTTIQTKLDLLKVIEGEHQKLSGEIDKLHELYQSSMIDKHGFGAKYKPWADRLRQLDNEIPALQAELDILKISQISEEEIILGAKNLYERWPNLSAQEKRTIIEAITEKITIGKDEVEINLYYAPSVPSITHPSVPQNKPDSNIPSTTAVNRSKGATNPQWFEGRDPL